MTLVRENWSTWRKTCPAAALSTTSSTWSGLESNPDLFGEKLVANCLRAMTKPFTDTHFTAFSQVCMLLFIMFPCYNITNILLTCHLKHSLLPCNIHFTYLPPKTFFVAMQCKYFFRCQWRGRVQMHILSHIGVHALTGRKSVCMTHWWSELQTHF